MADDSERVYTIPLGKVLLSPDNRRAMRAINMIREFARRHMKVQEIKIDQALSHEIWARGIRRPPRKVRVRMSKTEEGHILVSPYSLGEAATEPASPADAAPAPEGAAGEDAADVPEGAAGDSPPSAGAGAPGVVEEAELPKGGAPDPKADKPAPEKPAPKDAPKAKADKPAPEKPAPKDAPKAKADKPAPEKPAPKDAPKAKSKGASQPGKEDAK